MVNMKMSSHRPIRPNWVSLGSRSVNRMNRRLPPPRSVRCAAKFGVGRWLILAVWATTALASAETLPASPAFPCAVELTRDYPPNLLRNPGFETVTATGGLPEGWDFGNMAGSPQVHGGSSPEAHSGARSAFATSTGDWPAYWVQALKVVEGVLYYSSVYSKAQLTEGTAGLRLYTSQYADAGSWATRNSNTDVRSYAEEGQGECLEDFIDPAYLNLYRRGQWNLQDLEFTVPTGKGVNQYVAWAGLYGIGTVCVDDAYFGPAAFTLTGRVTGLGLTRLRILDSRGQEYLNQPLAVADGSHAFRTTLPSRLKQYQLELTDSQAKTWRRPL